jgi:predicted Holliday junction resolvase-like endonuclease
MVYFLSAALILLLLALLVALYFRNELKDLHKHYNLQAEFLQSAKKIADEAIRENVELSRKANAFEQCIRGLEGSRDLALELQRKQLEAAFELQAQAIRHDAIQRAKVVNKGFDGETFSPFSMKGFNPKDFQFVGGTIDFLVYKGLSDYNKGDESIDLYLLEIKTGNADLNDRQRQLRNAVKAGKVYFATFNPDKQELRRWSCQTDEKITLGNVSENL